MTSLCEQVVDEENGQLCNKPATDSISVRNRSASFKVRVCKEHKALHNRKHAQLRAESKK